MSSWQYAESAWETEATWWIWVTSYNSILTLCVCFTCLSVQLPRTARLNHVWTTPHWDVALSDVSDVFTNIEPFSSDSDWVPVLEGLDLLPIQVEVEEVWSSSVSQNSSTLSLKWTMPPLSTIVIKRDLRLAIYEVSNGRLAIINRGVALTKAALMRAQTRCFLWCD